MYVNEQNKVPLLCSYCHRVTEAVVGGAWGGHLLLAQAQTPRAGCPDCGYACNISAFSVLLHLRLHSSYSSHSYLQAQPQDDCRGIYRCNTSLKQQRCSPEACTAELRCPDKMCVSFWAGGRMSREWEADLQSFLYNTTKNISYAFCSSWSTFAFAHFCTKPVLPVGLEVTTALIFGDRSMVFIKWKTPFVHPQNWKHHSLVFWRRAFIPILMETHSPPADKEKHCDLMEFVVNLTDIMM